jgi:hypothetical protein
MAELWQLIGAFFAGGFSGGILVNELLKHHLDRRRVRDARQIEHLRMLQEALELINRGRVIYVATKIAASTIMERWPSALPTPEEDAYWYHGESIIRAVLPSIHDEQVRIYVRTFEKAARDAMAAKNAAEAGPLVEAAREALEAAHERIGKVVQAL